MSTFYGYVDPSWHKPAQMPLLTKPQKCDRKSLKAQAGLKIPPMQILFRILNGVWWSSAAGLKGVHLVWTNVLGVSKNIHVTTHVSLCDLSL